MDGFDSASRTRRATVSRCTPSVLAIRRNDQAPDLSTGSVVVRFASLEDLSAHGQNEHAACDTRKPATILLEARKRGDYDIAYQYAGQGVGLVTEERPAAEVVAGLAAGAERLLRGWG